MEVTSHIAGKNATVRVYPDRIEWDRKGRVTATRLATAGMLGGLRKDGGTEMVLMKHITGVRTAKDGIMNHAVEIVTAGNTVKMRVSKSEAEQLVRIIQQQVAQA